MAPLTLPANIGGAPNPSLLDDGISVVLASGVAAAQTISNAGTGQAITTTNPLFTIPAATYRPRVLNLKAKGVGALPTTMSVTLFTSDDNGTTWQAYGAAIALVTTTVATDAQIVNIAAGLMCQLLVTALTLGSASSVSVDGVLS